MYKILIVDDEIEYLQLIFDIIRKSGEEYKILRALDANLALTIAEKSLPDIIITDWEMPEINGIELIKKLKENHKTKHIPVIMCTGVMTNSQNLKIAFEAGAVDFIRKPIDEIELLSRIKSMILLINSLHEIEKQKQIILEKEKKMILLKLEEKNRELTTYAIQLLTKKKENLQIIENLKKLSRLTKNAEIKASIYEMVFQLQQNLTKNNWEEFKKYFEGVYTSFFIRLNQDYPILTQGDLKICAFIRLNMVSKDIAQISGLSPKSVDVARYRIRKKLNLKREDSLYKFLSEI